MLDKKLLERRIADIINVVTPMYGQLAVKITDEWSAQGAKVRSETMPYTQLAMTALDMIAPKKDQVVASLAAYAESELLCHRADEPPELAARQEQMWQPWLEWASRKYGYYEKNENKQGDLVPLPLAGGVRGGPNVSNSTSLASSPPPSPPASGRGAQAAPTTKDNQQFLCVVKGIMPIVQPKESLAALGNAVADYDPFHLAGLQQAVGVSGSLILGLALAEGKATAAEVFNAAELDSLFQMEKWGEDPVTTERHKGVRRDLEICECWFKLLR